MNVFRLHELTASVRRVLQWWGIADCLRQQNRGSQRFTDEMYGLMLRDIGHARDVCARAGFRSSAERIGLIHQRLDLNRAQVDSSYIAAELANAYDGIEEAAVKNRFLRVRLQRQGCIDNPNLMGPEVAKAFQKAVPDIVEAGNCLAADCNTAAVFHLMRAFEWGIRTFAADLGLSRFSDWSKQEQRFKYTPSGFAVWEKFITQLPGKIEKKIKTLRPSKLRQRRQEYYYSVYDDIKTVKAAWRNHVMHARMEFKDRDADAVFARVKNMLMRMAAKP